MNKIQVYIFFCFLSMLFAAKASPDAADLKILKGDREIQFSGAVVLDSRKGDDYRANIEKGWFVIDGLVMGVKGLAVYNDEETRFGVGVYSDYHFDLGFYFVPFMGIAAVYESGELSAGESGGVVIGDVYAGFKYFITAGLAWSGRVLFQHATTDDYFQTSTGSDDKRISIRFGLHYHY